jgi:hypothetical protein
MQRIFEIPVTDLRPGLTVWEYDDRKKGYYPDVYLADYFLADYPAREFIIGHRLQFKTGTGNTVVWRNSGNVVVSIGRAAKETIRKVG